MSPFMWGVLLAHIVEHGYGCLLGIGADGNVCPISPLPPVCVVVTCWTLMTVSIDTDTQGGLEITRVYLPHLQAGFCFTCPV